MSRAPLRIAFATDWFLPRLGGIELHLADLATRLVADGHHVTVITSTPGATAPAGVELVPLDVARLPLVDVAASPRLVPALSGALERGRFDVVHAHASVVSPVAFVAAAAAHRLQLPLVVTFHSMLHAGAIALALADRMAGWTRWPLVLSAVSGTVARQVERATGRGTVRVLPNGLDATPWRLSRTSAGGFVVVSTMRLHRKKRAVALLRAFTRARELAPQRPLRLVIVGDGPQRTMLERYAATLGIGGDVEFTGRLSRPEIAERYASADAFASATRHESFGIAALEARAAGLPVVAMRVSGASEFLRHGANALLADSDAELAQHMAALSSDPALYARLAASSGDVEQFTWDQVIRQHIAAYDDAIAIRSGHRGHRTP